MTVTLSDTDTKNLRRIGTALANDLVPVKEVRSFITGLLRKVDDTASAAPVVRKRIKQARKEVYRSKLMS